MTCPHFVEDTTGSCRCRFTSKKCYLQCGAHWHIRYEAIFSVANQLPAS